MNAPEFDVANVGINPVTGELDVRYPLDTLLANADYPLGVHFYYEQPAIPGVASMIYLGMDQVDSVPDPGP